MNKIVMLRNHIILLFLVLISFSCDGVQKKKQNIIRPVRFVLSYDMVVNRGIIVYEKGPILKIVLQIENNSTENVFLLKEASFLSGVIYRTVKQDLDLYFEKPHLLEKNIKPNSKNELELNFLPLPYNSLKDAKDNSAVLKENSFDIVLSPTFSNLFSKSFVFVKTDLDKIPIVYYFNDTLVTESSEQFIVNRYDFKY